MKRMLAISASFMAAIASSSSAAGIPIGNRIAVLRAPAIGLVTPVFQGSYKLEDGTAWPPELRHGPALYPDTSYPCTKGTVALAGHHLTNSHPFLHAAELKPGSVIKLSTRYGSCSYRVIKVASVSEDAAWVLNWGGGDGHRLVLTTCDQIYNSQGVQVGLRRTVVFAEEKK